MFGGNNGYAIAKGNTQQAKR